MNFDSSVHNVVERGFEPPPGSGPSQPAAMELIVGGRRRSLCAPARVVLESGPFWRGYRMQHVRIPAKGMLEHMSTPHHRVLLIAAGSCDVRYRADVRDAKCRLSLGSFCFVSRGYEFERLAWKSAGGEAFVVDITDIGPDPNPIDAFGRTDALFDMHMGFEDARVATLIDLMRAEIDSGCPTGSSYAEALSLALASRIASLCASIPGTARRTATLSPKQLSRITEHVARSLPDDLTIDRRRGKRARGRRRRTAGARALAPIPPLWQGSPRSRPL